jgi:hypothetical protein
MKSLEVTYQRPPAHRTHLIKYHTVTEIIERQSCLASDVSQRNGFEESGKSFQLKIPAIKTTDLTGDFTRLTRLKNVNPEAYYIG